MRTDVFLQRNWADLIPVITSESDRGAVIVCASLLEDYIEKTFYLNVSNLHSIKRFHY